MLNDVIVETCKVSLLWIDSYAVKMHQQIVLLLSKIIDKQLCRKDMIFMGISAALIVKNEERCISRCILSVLPAVDEVIVVDTGSTDNTIEIVSKLALESNKVKLFHFEWIDDFSAARNFSLSLVSNDWAFVIDADELLPKEEHFKLRKYTKMLDDTYDGKVALYIVSDSITNGEISHSHELAYIRLFPSCLRFKDRIHETLDIPDGFHVTTCDVHIHHDGYDASVVDQVQKRNRNLILLYRNLVDDPNNARLWMQLGRELIGTDNEKALGCLDMASSIAVSSEDNDLILQWIEDTRKAIIAAV
ncbi:glycosyltransferase family 2 protein [Paenibacillus albus]|uniref:glycosyltransferase family 2 protein n=1 Tax=Paenibacillus albus TaxID=2495582 RepID=UPI0013DECD31|nr:glycosyltransferase family 2 protein [Paenibacillus albus]